MLRRLGQISRLVLGLLQHASSPLMGSIGKGGTAPSVCVMFNMSNKFGILLMSTTFGNTAQTCSMV